MLSGKSLAICQASTEPNRPLSGEESPSALGHPRYRPERLPEGVDNYYEFPGTEPKLQGCIENHAVRITQIWNRFKIGKIPHYGFVGPVLAVQITIASALHPLKPLLCSQDGQIPVTVIH
jgi:hypothetical protein